ncbi:hypothetical protein GCM10020000_27320 [Streptomyces olivoverticillatus]
MVVDVDHVHVLGEVGQEDRALPGAAHQVQALTGVHLVVLLAAGAVLRVEFDEALVGHHRALAGEDVVVTGEGDAQHLRVLQGVAVLRLGFGAAEKAGSACLFALPQPRARSRSVLSSLGCTTTNPWPEKPSW